MYYPPYITIYIASHISGKSTNQIRSFFSIENDFASPEDENRKLNTRALPTSTKARKVIPPPEEVIIKEDDRPLDDLLNFIDGMKIHSTSLFFYFFHKYIFYNFFQTFVSRRRDFR